MRTLKRVLVACLGIVLVATAAFYLAEPVAGGRLLAMPFGGVAGVAQRVAGGTVVPLPVAGAGARTIDSGALEAAVAYGADTGSHALLVWHDGALQLEHYYPGYGPESRTPTQSMHKSVLALLVGIAIRDGFIASVDDPAARYLTEWAGDGRAAITIRQMLQQQSGIGFPTFSFWNPRSDSLQLMVGGDVARVAFAQTLEDPPGSRFDYNNVNPQLLGILLERATGRRHADYLSEALWRRIGADDATVLLDSAGRGMARTFCCLDATARSWLQVGLLHLHGGVHDGEQVVPAAWMREVVTPSPRNPDYGYLTWLGTGYQERRAYNHKTSATAYHAEPFAAPDVIYFDGFGGARVYVVPSQGLVIVRTGDIAFDWDDAKLPNLLLRGIRARDSVATGVAPTGR
ncbi:MAG: serine hydrolase [Gammaproteobacteria bacterium]|nr:serine hydrolase [Gammaproteobacteria bacterium]